MIATEKIIETNWWPEQELIETKLIGEVDLDDINLWKHSLKEALNKIPGGGSFKIMVNLYGFKAVNIEAHKQYREIIPLLLAQYDWKVGYVDLFQESKTMKFSRTSGIHCYAAVHVHHDKEKIGKYEENFGRENEHFMTDPEKAMQWILNYHP
jgi:hypothetical protein